MEWHDSFDNNVSSYWCVFSAVFVADFCVYIESFWQVFRFPVFANSTFILSFHEYGFDEADSIVIIVILTKIREEKVIVSKKKKEVVRGRK